jgi:DNA polymerase-3 subunit epsilon
MTAAPDAPARLPVPHRPSSLPRSGTPDGPSQGTFDDLIDLSARPLRDLTFVVVDLETTGGSPASCEITEIGAVKVRAGEVLGEMQTLVRPGAPIPPFIAVLTGITDVMVASAPRLEAALPAFLEFARGAVLVAHNAPFDLGFLKAACERTGMTWPAAESVDTARLARRVLTRDETPNCKLSSLAQLFRATEPPCHRALADARATVDVLHGLFERLGSLGVTTIEELKAFTAMVPPAVRRKRHLANTLPSAPGVYLFRDAQGRVLYVGTSRNLRVRVRSYFTASEPRTRMAEMVGLAEAVDAVPCAHALEAAVRELRLIAEHKPRYNRRSRFPERSIYLKLTVEPFPRISQVRVVRDDGAVYLGPLGSRRAAELATAAIHEAFPLRQCTARISVRSRSPACVLAEMGRCGAPCDGRQSAAEYATHVEAARKAWLADPEQLVTRLRSRMSGLAESGRYEEAALHRDRLTTFVRAAARLQRLTALTTIPQLVAAAPDGAGGWELSVVRHGRLVASGVAPLGAAVRPFLTALIATAETVDPGPGPLPCTTAEETECILRWLSRPGVRLVELDGSWSSPAFGAGRFGRLLEAAGEDRSRLRPLEDRRSLRPQSRPARSGPVDRFSPSSPPPQEQHQWSPQ